MSTQLKATVFDTHRHQLHQQQNAATAGSTDTDSDWNKAKPELEPTSSAHLPPLSHNNFTKIKPASSENSILFSAQLSSAWLTSGRYDNFPACSFLYLNVPHKVLHMHWRVFLFCLECVSRFEFKKLRLIRHSKIRSSISLLPIRDAPQWKNDDSLIALKLFFPTHVQSVKYLWSLKWY